MYNAANLRPPPSKYTRVEVVHEEYRRLVTEFIKSGKIPTEDEKDRLKQLAKELV